MGLSLNRRWMDVPNTMQRPKALGEGDTHTHGVKEKQRIFSFIFCCSEILSDLKSQMSKLTQQQQ